MRKTGQTILLKGNFIFSLSHNNTCTIIHFASCKHMQNLNQGMRFVYLSNLQPTKTQMSLCTSCKISAECVLRAQYDHLIETVLLSTNSIFCWEIKLLITDSILSRDQVWLYYQFVQEWHSADSSPFRRQPAIGICDPAWSAMRTS